MSPTSKPAALTVVGVMTGSSCDGLDAACMRFENGSWRMLWFKSAPIAPTLRKRVLTVQEPGVKLTLKSLLELDRDLGEWFGDAVEKMLEGEEHADAVCAHGQTIAHHPAAHARGVTLQIGDAARLSARTGTTVVSRLRNGDMAAGGQGAPLAPLFHAMLARQLELDRSGVAVHNLGGISNLTYLSPTGQILAFDTGPGNIWIDFAAEKATAGKRKFDKDGQLARKGSVAAAQLDRLLKHPYFGKAPPKSCGRDDFPAALLLKSRAKTRDLPALATALTVESIARAYEKTIFSKNLPLDSILLCGGGAKNTYLVDLLGARLNPVRVSTLDKMGIDSQSIEAQAFAVFGFLSLLGFPLGGAWTGASGFGAPGHVLPGPNWGMLLQKLASWQDQDVEKLLPSPS
jgi:anhydro-N-acetylmuramic acid kinase